MKTSRPTTILKQKKVLKNLGENGGNFRKAIKSAGYSQKYADNPQRLINTKTWQELTEEMLPDALLATIHHQLLLNEDTRLKALHLAYKIKGKYKEAEESESKTFRFTKIVIVNPNNNQEVLNQSLVATDEAS